MKRLIFAIFLIIAMATPVKALEFQAPDPPDGIELFSQEESESFSEGLIYIIKSALNEFSPSLAKATSICLSLIAVTIINSIVFGLSNNKKMIELASTVTIGLLLLQPTSAFVADGVNTVQQLCEYGNLLLPVMTAALSAQGYVTTSGSMYVGTAVTNTILVNIVSRIITPIIYIYLCLCMVKCAAHNEFIDKLRMAIKWIFTWGLKIILYVFTGYITITGVISGTTDASALKAAKIAISGTVPLVGGIISDASEAILVSAGVMKNAAGVYGMLVMIAICIGPFLRIGVQYLMLKTTAAVCSAFSEKSSTVLIEDFSDSMGMILAITGTVCVIHLISTICFLKGAG